LIKDLANLLSEFKISQIIAMLTIEFTHRAHIRGSDINTLWLKDYLRLHHKWPR
jgi:hypothetical protein